MPETRLVVTQAKTSLVCFATVLLFTACPICCILLLLNPCWHYRFPGFSLPLCDYFPSGLFSRGKYSHKFKTSAELPSCIRHFTNKSLLPVAEEKNDWNCLSNPRCSDTHPSLFPYSQILCNITSKILNRKLNPAGFQGGFKVAVLRAGEDPHATSERHWKANWKKSWVYFCCVNQGYDLVHSHQDYFPVP